MIIDILVNLFEHGRDLRASLEAEQARDTRKLNDLTRSRLTARRIEVGMALFPSIVYVRCI